MKRLRPMMLGMILATASTPGLAQQPARQPPTATELFAHLSTCAQLAKKILDTRGGHGPDWDDPVVDLRYDPAMDHCYVEMVMVSPPNLWGGGRTLELLATTTIYRTLGRTDSRAIGDDHDFPERSKALWHGFR